MEEKSHCDTALWQARFEDGITYMLSSEEGVVNAEETGIKGELLERLSSSFIFKTSGSSGKSKWVVHSKSCVLRHAVLVNAHLEVSKDDIFGLVLPIHHVGGLGSITRSIVGAAKLVTFCDKWSASSCVQFITENNVSVISFVPTQLVDLVNAGFHCPESVRIAVVGGGSIDDDTLSSALELGWPVMESYGMTETGSQIATSRISETNYLRLIDGWQVRVNEDELLEIKGDCLFKGYLEESDGSFEFYDPKVDGWFNTSDKVDLLKGEEVVGLRFLGRSDEKVKILGELVDISMLENRLIKTLGHDVFIVPLPDSRRGMKLYPVVDQANLINAIHNLGWSGLDHLEEAVVVAHYPRNEMGKLQRTKLVEIVESVVFSSD